MKAETRTYDAIPEGEYDKVCKERDKLREDLNKAETELKEWRDCHACSCFMAGPQQWSECLNHVRLENVIAEIRQSYAQAAHNPLCSKQSGPVSECHICRGIANSARELTPEEGKEHARAMLSFYDKGDGNEPA